MGKSVLNLPLSTTLFHFSPLMMTFYTFNTLKSSPFCCRGRISQKTKTICLDISPNRWFFYNIRTISILFILQKCIRYILTSLYCSFPSLVTGVLFFSCTLLYITNATANTISIMESTCEAAIPPNAFITSWSVLSPSMMNRPTP